MPFLRDMRSSLGAEYQDKEDDMGRECSMHGEKMDAYRILMVKPDIKRQLGRTRCKWEEHIRMDLREIG
jgi:hypothetical protein